MHKLSSVLADPDRDLKHFSIAPMLQCLILYGGKDRQFAVPLRVLQGSNLFFLGGWQWHWQAWQVSF
jgi:hypothetical protein